MTNSRQLVTIELSGLPSTGKTTIARMLKESLVERGIGCQIVSSAGDIGSPIKNKLTYEYDVWAGCRAIMELISAKQFDESQVLVFDRGLIDTVCWLEYFSRVDVDSKGLTSVFSDFLMLKQWFLPTYLNFTLVAEFDTVLSRGKSPKGVVKNKHHTALKSIYESVANSKKVQELCEWSLVIETDAMTIQETVNRIVSDLRPFIR